MTTRPRLRQLEALKSVVDHGSMTRALQSLEILQPAVSRLLADLSNELGFVLPERKDGRLVPKTLTTDIHRPLLGGCDEKQTLS